MSPNNSVFHVSHKLSETSLHRRLRNAIFVEPLRKPAQGFGRNVGIVALFSGSVPAFGQLPLIVVAPNCLQVSMNMEVFLVGNAEELEPATERFSTGVSIEGVRDALIFEPGVGEGSNVANVFLAVALFGLEPLAIDSEVVSLRDLQELHSGNGTDGVPVGIVQRVSRRIQLEISRRRDVSALAKTLPVDLPGSSASLLKMELAPSFDHLRVSITFVGVDTVDS